MYIRMDMDVLTLRVKVAELAAAKGVEERRHILPVISAACVRGDGRRLWIDYRKRRVAEVGSS